MPGENPKREQNILMKFLATRSTRRVALVGLIVLLAGILAVTALATSIPAQVIVNFEGLGFMDGMDYGSGLFTQGDFTFNLSAGDFAEGAGMFCFGGTGGCINATGVGPESITIQTTSGNTFNFASFWDLNVCGGGIASAQGYLNGTPVVTQTTGFISDTTCMGTSGTVTMASGFQNVNKVVLIAQSTGFADNLDQFIFNPTAANQTITFNNPGAQNFGTSPTLTATATSGLTVTFSSSTTGVCTITSGGALTFITTGTCTINADQAGNVNYFPATTVSRSFTVNAVVPGAPTIGTATAGNAQATVTFTAPAFTGGATIIGYTVTSSPGGLTGTGASSPVTVTGLTNGTAYTFTVTATNSAGTGSASSASNSVTPKAAQTITFNNPGTQNFGTTPTLTATATSGLSVAFTSTTTGVCTITTGGALTFVAVGSCTINANQAGNGAYLAASQVTQTFSVAAVVPGAPTIGAATGGNAQASVTFTPPVFTGGTAITLYTATSNPGGLTGTGTSSPIVVTGLTNGTAYTFTVTATNGAGTGSASAASNSVTPSNTQTITFTNPGSQNFGSTPTLIATATSGLAVVFTSLTPGVCTITSGGALTFTGTGTCTINANQPGNGTYLAAPQVSQTFSVVAVAPAAPGLVTATPGNAQASVAFVAPVSNGGAPITLYTVTSNPGGITRTGVSSPITVTGLANGTAYTFTVTATNSAGTGPASSPSNSVTPGTNIVQAGTISVVSGSGQTGALGTPFAAPLVVLVQDGSG